ncbi:insulinase family protein [Sphingomonas sabuli]|uniref:Insulinase family protein n=1 Tax=Sphingomonas sabuli TaxID=2764186 RepID=A0A7G9L2E0_9SPHN|nr:M16 family metallopeptidase [Sphingomonas sabuli]QNM82789.1 insulinase family protein [Sphingomonas sabuli]
MPAVARELSPAPLAAAVQAPWLPATDVVGDPAVRYGTLPNGMKYAIMRNATPKGAASVRLRFEFGSIGESEKELGLAHFIEHMAFNGTTNVPEGEMIKILERQGLKFGPDTNAATGFDSTTYMLDLPSTDAERLDTAFMLMREVASELKFDAAAVDRERGVILGERRSRENAQLKRAIDTLAFTGPDTPYAKRLPIGTVDVISTASDATLRDLYRRYYRPELATLVFVGDADPALIEQKIRAKFSDWKGTGTAGAPLPRGKVDLNRAAAFDTFVDPAIPEYLQITSLRAWDDPKDTLAERRADTVKALAASMFNRRIERIANAPDAVIVGGGMGLDTMRDAARVTVVSLVAKDGYWKDAATIADQELRRALQFGFKPAELDIVKTEMVSKLTQAAQQAESRKNSAIAAGILGVLENNDVFTSPQYDADFVARVAPTITVDEVNAEFRKLWDGSPRLIHASSKTAVTGAQLAEAVAQSSKVAVTAPADVAVKAWAYDSFGTPGKVVQDTRIADLGLRTLKFANNVRLNVKRSDFEPGKVSYLVRMDGGNLAMPKDKPGLGAFVGNMAAFAGTAKHDLEELKTLTAGKQVTPGFVATEGAFVSGGTTNAADLPLQMKLSAAYMTDPGYRPEAQSKWAALMPLFDKQIGSQPAPLLRARLPYLLSGKDARFGIPPVDQLVGRSLDEFKQVYAPISASAPIEITVIGDVDEAVVIDAVSRSFGALPARQAAAPDYAAARAGTWNPGTGTLALTHSGDADQAVAGAVWHTDDDHDLRTEMGLEILANVMDLMLTDTIREKLGASYNASVSSTMSSEYRGFGYITTSSVVDPAKADAVDAAIAEAAAELRAKPIDADMLARAVNPEVESARRTMRENSFWVNMLSDAQARPARLERMRKWVDMLQSVTAADVHRLANAYLTPDRMNRIRVTSEKLAAK